ncbi:MAG: lipopolysaccharide kinase InaA family protein [Desulfobacterales bacterium]
MKLKEFFHSGNDRDILLHNSIGSFEELWKIKSDFIENPNYRRGGWSGIILHGIQLQNGQPLKIVIKRQENHTFRSFLHPLRGAPTLFREYNNICRLEKYGIPTLKPLYYGERRAGGNIRAVLVIRFLEEYRNLDEVFKEAGENEVSGLNYIIDAVAGMTAKVHSRRLQHSCLYGKHVFVKTEKEAPPDVRLIDLEKMHYGLSRFSVAIHDLSSLFRHSRWSEEVWNLFIQSYLRKAGLKSKKKRLLKSLDKKIEAKASKQFT